MERRGMPDQGDPRRRRRGEQPIAALAVASFVLSMTLCCPVTSLVGAGLGVVALRQIARSRGALGGRGLAIAAVVLGAAALVVQVMLLEHLARTQLARLERRATERVEHFIQAVERGDASAARSQWSDTVTLPGAAELDELRLELDRRFGELRSTTVVSRSTEGSFLAPRLEVAFVFSFERAELAGAARFALRTTPGGLGGLGGSGGSGGSRGSPGSLHGEDARLLELRIGDLAGGSIMLPRESGPPVLRPASAPSTLPSPP